jgi:hypothetical protein
METDDKNQSNVGRPTKYNDKTMATLYAALADGLPIKSAAIKAGIGVSTLNDWRERYPEVETGIEQARDRFREKALQTIKTAFEQGDWRAAVAALKLVFEEYREGTRINVNATAQVGVVMAEPERLKLIEARRRLALERVGATPAKTELHQGD